MTLEERVAMRFLPSVPRWPIVSRPGLPSGDHVPGGGLPNSRQARFLAILLLPCWRWMQALVVGKCRSLGAGQRQFGILNGLSFGSSDRWLGSSQVIPGIFWRRLPPDFMSALSSLRMSAGTLGELGQNGDTMEHDLRSLTAEAVLCVLLGVKYLTQDHSLSEGIIR